MCGSCEPKLAKASMLLGIVSFLIGIVSHVAGIAVRGAGPKSFAAAAALFLLLAIAANTTRSHGDHP